MIPVSATAGTAGVKTGVAAPQAEQRGARNYDAGRCGYAQNLTKKKTLLLSSACIELGLHFR